MDRIKIDKYVHRKQCATCENYECNRKNDEVDAQGLCKAKLNTPSTYDTTCSIWKEVK